MKIECVKDKLKQAVNLTEKIVGRNLSLPILANIFIEAKDKKIIIRSTNLDVGLEVIIPAIIEKEGVFTVKPQILSGFLNNINNEEKLKIELDGGNMRVSASNNSTVIKCELADDFPVLPVIKKGQEFIIDSKKLISGLKSVYFSASGSDIKPEIASVYIYNHNNELYFVSTDSFRLAERKINIGNINNSYQLIIPIKNINEIIRVFDDYVGEIKVISDNNQISFYGDNVYLTSRLIDGVYPDYKQIMPTSFKTEVRVKKDDIVQALKLSNVFINKMNQIDLSVYNKEGVIKIKSENQDIGENITSIKVEIKGGDDISMNFNVRYISECFQSIKDDYLYLNFNESNKPLFIKGDNDNSFSYIIMPLNR